MLRFRTVRLKNNVIFQSAQTKINDNFAANLIVSSLRNFTIFTNTNYHLQKNSNISEFSLDPWKKSTEKKQYQSERIPKSSPKLTKKRASKTNIQDTKADDRPHHRLFYNKRSRKPILAKSFEKQSDVIVEKAKKLDLKTKAFFKNCKESNEIISSPGKNLEIITLLEEHAEIFRDRKNQLQTFDDVVQPDFVDSDFDTPLKILEKTAKSYDKLMNILLDLEESSLKNSNKILVKGNKPYFVNALLNAWGTTMSSSLGTNKILKLLKRLEKIEKNSKGKSRLVLDNKTYNNVMSALQKANSQTGVSEDVFLEIEKIFNHMNSSTIQRKRPDKFSFHEIMNCTIRFYPWRDKRGALKVEKYFEELKTYYEKTNDPLLIPDKFSYGIVMYANVKAGNVERAEEVLLQLDSLHQKTMNEIYQSGLVNYGTVITGYCRRRTKKNDPDQAEKILKLMIKRYHDGNKEAKPNWIIFNHVIEAYAKTRQPERAEGILNMMEQEYKDGNFNVKPNVRSYAIVADAWARQRSSLGVKKALATLDSMEKLGVQPNEVVYNAVLNAIARSKDKDAPFMAQKIVDEMNDRYNSGKNKFVKPDARSYTSIMLAWLESSGHFRDKRRIIEQLEHIINEMEHLSRNTLSNADIAPDVYNYNIYLDALHKFDIKDELCEKSLAILEKCETAYYNGNTKLQPTPWLYNAVLMNLSKSEKDGSSKLALKVLKQFDKLTEFNPHIKPDERTYSLFLLCLRTDESLPITEEIVQQGEKILTAMQDRYKAGEKQLKPSFFILDYFLALVAKSNIANKAERAWEKYQFFKELHEDDKFVKASIHTYNWLLSAIAYDNDEASGKQAEDIRKLEMATKLYSELLDDKNRHIISYSSNTYMYLLIIAKRFVHDYKLRYQAVEEIFLRCCLDGLVDRAILNQVHDILIEDAKDTLPDDYDWNQAVINESIPTEWSRNVSLQYRPY